MWALTNNTPFTAERSWVREKNGAEVWLVAVKGTFTIEDNGALKIAEEQEEVNIAPVFRGDPQSTSLLYDTDLPHRKNSTDILIDGHAYAPNGNAVETIDVTLRVANIDKTLRVFGDRAWQNSLTGVSISNTQPFVKMPLTYERAFGGTDQYSDDPKNHDWEPRNPIGLGFATKAEYLIEKPLPNIEDPASLINNWKERPQPMGFGPIAGHWSPRVELAGTYDENWEKNRQPLLPENFNDDYHQSAPKDQQTKGFIEREELFELYNMTPTGELKFRLPRTSIGFTTHFDDNTKEEHRASLHTVMIKPDTSKVVLVWHTHLECHHKVLKLMNTTIRVKQRVLDPVKEESRNEPVPA